MVTPLTATSDVVLPLAHTVHRELAARIIAGQYPPGQRLVERELAQEFGVSRVPIREAIHRLQRDGLVDLSIRRGARVHVQTVEELEDLYNLREALEGLGAKLAAKHRTEAELQELRRLHVAYLRDFARGAHREGLAKTQSWHDVLMRASCSPALLLAVESVVQRVNWTLRQYNDEAKLVADHERIMVAVEAQNCAAAERAAKRHALNGRTIVLAALRDRTT